MSWFTEDSTPFLVIGAVTEAILVLALVKTGRVYLLYCMAGVAIVVGAIVFIEKHTITDTKRVRAVLDAATAAAEQNNVDGVLALISPTSTSMRGAVQSYLPKFEFHEVHLSNLDIKINRFHNPPSATAEFTALASGKDRTGMYPYDHFARRIKVTLHLENDRWLFESYEDVRNQGPGGTPGS